MTILTDEDSRVILEHAALVRALRQINAQLATQGGTRDPGDVLEDIDVVMAQLPPHVLNERAPVDAVRG